MREFEIGKNEADQRLDKYLKKLLPNAGSSFMYKMLRKKNILWNGKKAEGSEKIQMGDRVSIFFSDDTFAKFSGISQGQEVQESQNPYRNIPFDKLDIVYEDEDIVILNKPSGMLSQKASPEDVSANEYLISYLLHTGAVTEHEFHTFRPSVCNRLDRNTSGLLIAGKSLRGLQQMSSILKERTVRKYYRCVVSGAVTEPAYIRGYLKKDEKTNRVSIQKKEAADAKYIETEYRPLRSDGEKTLLEVHLITGRSHQIRAHLASIGHPIIGDTKYGKTSVNEKWRKCCGIKSQLLHAFRMELPDGRIFTAPVGSEFEDIWKNDRSEKNG